MVRGSTRPLFLCAPTEAQAIAWTAGLAPLLTPAGEAPPTYGALLWRRVRLRLTALAERHRGVRGGGAADEEWGVRATGGTRLGSLARMLRTMAAEETARLEWVRYHLEQGDRHGAALMGWRAPAAIPPPPDAKSAADAATANAATADASSVDSRVVGANAGGRGGVLAGGERVAE